MKCEGCGGNGMKGRCFCMEGTSRLAGNRLELLPSAPLSSENGCNLRKLCSRQAILLEYEGCLVF
jgi:hypothetical protein